MRNELLQLTNRPFKTTNQLIFDLFFCCFCCSFSPLLCSIYHHHPSTTTTTTTSSNRNFPFYWISVCVYVCYCYSFILFVCFQLLISGWWFWCSFFSILISTNNNNNDNIIIIIINNNNIKSTRLFFRSIMCVVFLLNSIQFNNCNNSSIVVGVWDLDWNKKKQTCSNFAFYLCCCCCCWP